LTDLADRVAKALAPRYRIEGVAGEGGMATVFLAEDLKHHRKVAVKVLRPELAAAMGSERFLREIEIAAQLSHPHVLPLHDSGEADGLLYYVMPYIEGRSLRDRISEEGALPVEDAVRILTQVAEALGQAHDRGLVHRDIKPANILLSGRHALVADFGVATALGDSTAQLELTTTGVLLGTPAYMAPEQASAAQDADHRADIFALGAVAYEMLTGKPPFTGSSATQILAALLTRTPDPISSQRDGVPEAVERAVMRCLEKEPGDRWQSAQELTQELEQLATPSGGVVAATGGTRRLGTDRTMALGAAGVVLLLAGVWLFGGRGSGASTLGDWPSEIERMVLDGDRWGALFSNNRSAGLVRDPRTFVGPRAAGERNEKPRVSDEPRATDLS